MRLQKSLIQLKQLGMHDVCWCSNYTTYLFLLFLLSKQSFCCFFFEEMISVCFLCYSQISLFSFGSFFIILF